MTEEPKLNPCPFCRSHDILILNADTTCGHIYFATCQPCGANGPDAEDAASAADLWNRRRAADPRKGDRYPAER